MVDVGGLLSKMIHNNASDMILKSDSPPVMRIYGDLVRLDDHANITPEDTDRIAKNVLTEQQYERFILTNEMDVAVNVPNLARFRVNLFKQKKIIGMVFRKIPHNIPELDDDQYNFSPILKDFALRPRGLLLVTGPSGCGKSTTIASMINYRNKKDACHIITVEDPIEFIYKDEKAIIDQREVGRDTKSFANAIKYALRQDPDVIVVGEMRDLETISLAITAAETGHLVLSSLHTNNAVETIDRIIDVFPPFQQRQIRLQLSANLIGAVSQILLKKKNKRGLIAGFEIMVSIAAIRKLIREAKTHQMPSVMQTMVKEGMRTMNMSLVSLVATGKISRYEAESNSPNLEEFAEMMAKYKKTEEK